MEKLKSFIGNLLRRRPYMVQTSQPTTASEASKMKFRDKAVETMKYVVKHSYRSKQKQHQRKKTSKRSRMLSYVSSAILEDYGAILPRRERKLLAKQGIPFRPYYN